ncbi:MAG: hypothetical protein HY710_10315 [Candidatus Latescibacteria bacterium]|nr:hypothetical protein [Candidatus Latescibacterota bacterium]
MTLFPQCPACRVSLTHIRGAHFRCPRCGADYGVFQKRDPYAGPHCVRLTTPAQIRLAERDPGPAPSK